MDEEVDTGPILSQKKFLFHFKTMPKYYMINNTLLQIEELYLNLITNTHKFVYQY